MSEVEWMPVKHSGVLMGMVCYVDGTFKSRIPTLKEYEEHGSAKLVDVKGGQSKRDSMMSDQDVRHINAGRLREGLPLFSAEDMRDFYEARITSGELLTKSEHERLLLQAIKDHESNQRGTW